MKLVAVKVMKTQLSFLFNNKLIRLRRMITKVTKLSNFLMRIKSEGFKNENVEGGVINIIYTKETFCWIHLKYSEH